MQCPICILVLAHNIIKYVVTLQSNADIAKEAGNMATNHGCLLCTGGVKKVEEVFLVLEKKILFAVKATHCAVVLFVAFFVVHLNFPIGANSFFQFLKHVFLKAKLPKKQALARLAAKLTV